MILCDSCGRAADPPHVRERIERLELATRFRPVHIRVLLIDAAPPTRRDDYFYRTIHDRSTDRSAKQSEGPVRFESASAYFDRLVNCACSERTPRISNEEAALAEFQRQGLFLAYAVECPVENLSGLSSVLKHSVPNLLKRVELSYKPKFIALLSRDLVELVPALKSSWGDRLILDDGSPFASAEWEASAANAPGGSNSPDRLAEAIRLLP